ncbi:MAG: hypothetical protein WDW36_003867 [Sanguina aurantia]
MANSKYEYVKGYELDDKLLPGCWIVVRLDGKGFTKFTDLHAFEKPNDKPALDLMDAAATEVMREFPDVRIAFGESDEYSFVFHPGTEIYGRRSSKLVSLVTSCFTANYVRKWATFLPHTAMRITPMFDGRAVCYPNTQTMRDYLAWRQADAHVNNQYNTCFWALVKDGQTPAEAQLTLKGTLTEFKNELLFSRFGINYSKISEQFKKGSTVIRQKVSTQKVLEDGTVVERSKKALVVLHVDIIRDEFWRQNPDLVHGTV